MAPTQPGMSGVRRSVSESHTAATDRAGGQAGEVTGCAQGLDGVRAQRGGTAAAGREEGQSVIHVPLRTVSGMNAREHWQARARRVKGERLLVAWHLASVKKPAVPLVVTLTRIAPSNGLDDDNLASAMKGCRDEVAEWLGVNDRDRKTVRYEYGQERGPWGVRIEWRPM